MLLITLKPRVDQALEVLVIARVDQVLEVVDRVSVIRGIYM